MSYYARIDSSQAYQVLSLKYTSITRRIIDKSKKGRQILVNDSESPFYFNYCCSSVKNRRIEWDCRVVKQAFSQVLLKSRHVTKEKKQTETVNFFHSLTLSSTLNSIFTSSPIIWNGAQYLISEKFLDSRRHFIDW